MIARDSNSPVNKACWVLWTIMAFGFTQIPLISQKLHQAVWYFTWNQILNLQFTELQKVLIEAFWCKKVDTITMYIHGILQIPVDLVWRMDIKSFIWFIFVFLVIPFVWRGTWMPNGVKVVMYKSEFCIETEEVYVAFVLAESFCRDAWIVQWTCFVHIFISVMKGLSCPSMARAFGFTDGG